MTPAEHRAEATRKLRAAEDWNPGDRQQSLATMALAHATLALASATAAPPPRPKPKPPARVEVFDVELNHLAVIDTPGGGVALIHPAADWSTLLDDPAQVRLLADTLTAHADRMENR